jgi:hypothetical protein
MEMKKEFDIKLYEASHQENPPVPPMKNRWFKFFAVDMDKDGQPDLPVSVFTHGNEDESLNVSSMRKKYGFWKGGKEWKKAQAKREDEIIAILEEWENTGEHLVRIKNPFLIYMGLLSAHDFGNAAWYIKIAFFAFSWFASIERIVSPKHYVGNNRAIKKLENLFWRLVEKLFFNKWMVVFWTIFVLWAAGQIFPSLLPTLPEGYKLN